MKRIHPERVTLAKHPEVKETWLQDQIANDPGILGLGDLILKDKERIQPRAGRLDLLLQDPDNNRRYEVEIQLGKTDEAHIVRTIEYWDIERKRYPQYDHCAVIVAEDITSRFLNIISLFNGHIPLIAIQLNAYKIPGQEGLALIFTKILDELPLGLVDEDEELQEVTDREYWLNRGTKETVKMADQVLDIIKEFAPDIEFKYNKFYIGLAKNGQPNNFTIFRPRKKDLNVEIRLPQSDEIQQKIDESGIDDMGYLKKWGKYRFRLSKADIVDHHELLKEIMQMAYDNS
ncbi:DUF5655 domain-containing protein [Lewinella sp. W8]|uniref:DUF5655 domain-containing protein n=1 Tax=Lewinella sp. W8 TaxID=2528208 RepID=UPI00106872D7|nr:DUF5655 domain-containing protein [Lewinella sp. W8]MTB50683.1 hypothetical protein [Lewinella sp. W8]